MPSEASHALVAIAFGAITALLAKDRGRNALAWFLIGLFLTCIALIVLLVLPNLRDERAKQQSLEVENQRLRERLRKDRMVADQRYEEARRRLSAHDRALGLDTRLDDPALAQELQSSARPVLAAGADWRGVEWFYALDAEPLGPVDFDELRRLWRSGAIGAWTPVWSEAIVDWKSLAEVPELEGALRA